MHTIVVDLGYGDAGKGSVVDWLCAEGRASTVVRFNGGAQAGHNVVTPDGRHHTFAQFGSGTFVPGVRTHLSRFVLVDPLALAAEAGRLGRIGVPDAVERLTVDREALLTTPYHQAANQARELDRDTDRHGSCGVGIGETARYALRYPADAPRVGDCLSPAIMRGKLLLLQERLAAELGGAHRLGRGLPGPGACVEAYRSFGCRVRIVDGNHLRRVLRTESVIFEGAQGVLLDETIGFHPYTTWSTTTFGNAETLLAEAGCTASRLGVVRAYLTRHGPGPFVTEDPVLTAELPDPHNAPGPWQGQFRVGHFDAVALRYALAACGGVDGLAITHLDVAAARDDLQICQTYQLAGTHVDELPPPGDLAAQRELTRRLLHARPVYGPLTDPVNQIRHALGTQAEVLSSGPDRTRKCCRPTLVTRRCA